MTTGVKKEEEVVVAAVAHVPIRAKSHVAMNVKPMQFGHQLHAVVLAKVHVTQTAQHHVTLQPNHQVAVAVAAEVLVAAVVPAIARRLARASAILVAIQVAYRIAVFNVQAAPIGNSLLWQR